MDKRCGAFARIAILLGSLLAPGLLSRGATAAELQILDLSRAASAASRDALEARGVRVTHVLPDGRLVAWLQEGTELARARALGTIEAQPWPRALPQAAAAPDWPHEELNEPDAVDPEELSQEGTDGPGPPSASPVLAGDVVVGIVLPESTGERDPNDFDWTSADVSDVISRVVEGTLRLALAPGAPRITFILHLFDAPPGGGTPGTVACAYEARRHYNFDGATDQSWLSALGYPDPDVMASRRLLAASLRDQYAADAAFLAKVVNDRNAPRVSASALVGGPQVTWFLSSPPYVVAHETAHAFGALDEYCPDACKSPSQLAGNVRASNANSRGTDGTGYFGGAGEGYPCLMLGDTPRICPHTRSQLGWDDLDADGRADVADLFAQASILAVDVEPEQIRVSGRATLAHHLGAQPVAIARLAGVEVRVGTGAWLRAEAVDGSFDSLDEPFHVTLPALPDGRYSFEARAVAN